MRIHYVLVSRYILGWFSNNAFVNKCSLSLVDQQRILDIHHQRYQIIFRKNTLFNSAIFYLIKLYMFLCCSITK